MKQPKKKILVKVWRPLIKPLKEKFEAACLLRDAYLDRVFSHEARMLDEEVDEPNSKEAKAHLNKHFGSLEWKSINFAFSPETVALIDDVCHRKNIPRDSFFNRVLLLLLGDQPALFNVILSDYEEYWEEILEDRSYEEFVPNATKGVLSEILDTVSDDPFWVIRLCIVQANDEVRDTWKELGRGNEINDLLHPPLHKFLIPAYLLKKKGVESVLGLNCFLPDHEIEGHPAYEAKQKSLDELFALFKGEKNEHVE